jgi:hypothetical protein
VELPQEDLKFTRTFSYKKVRRAEGASAKKVSYAVRDVLFRNKKVELSGTLTVPNGDSPRPPVVLIPDSGVVDRDCLGIFSDIADRLTENGFAVLRFDKRGIGSSTGDFGSLSDEDERADIKAAIEFLATQKGIDMGRLVVLGYSKGGYLASRIASEDARVKGCIILAGLAYTNEALSGFQALRARAVRDNWPEAYIKIALQSKLEAMDIVKKTDKGWQSLLGRRCFIKKMREEMEERPLETMKNVKVPVLLLHGSNDDQVPSEYAKLLDRSLEEAGNMARTLVYFGYLSHYFGKRVFDGKSRVAYAVDAQALDTIGNWLKNVVGPSSAPQGSVGTENPKG